MPVVGESRASTPYTFGSSSERPPAPIRSTTILFEIERRSRPLSRAFEVWSVATMSVWTSEYGMP
jgi:hypothetical protein